MSVQSHSRRVATAAGAMVLIAISAGCGSAGFKPKGVGPGSGDAPSAATDTPASTVDSAAMRDYYASNVQNLLEFGVPYDEAIEAWSTSGVDGGPSMCQSAASVEQMLGDPPTVPDAVLQARLMASLAHGLAALRACGATPADSSAVVDVRKARTDLVAIVGAIQDAGS